jgi:Xaa-Pro aminopeptidase
MNYRERLDRTRQRMDTLGVDVLLASCGPDLTYLTGYEAVPLERLTALILARGDESTLLVPRLEAARVEERPDVFNLETWDEDEDPVERVAAHVRSAQIVAVADHASARLLLALQDALPRARFIRASLVTSPLRARSAGYKPRLMRLMRSRMACGFVRWAVGRSETSNGC